jgi:predicted transcriptional regulator
LYELGLNGNMVQNGTRQSNGKYYIDNSRFLKYDYKFSDPADSNNVYIWTKMESGNVDSMKDYVRDNMQRLKTMTHEIVLLNPIMVQFAITAAPTDVVQDYINNQSDFDENQDSYIEITLDDNSLYSTAVVQTEIENKFISFFNTRNNKLGQNVKFQDLMNDIYGINGI